MLAVVLASAVAPAGAVAPPLDTIIRQHTEQTRSDGRTTRTFRLDRELVFAAEPAGFRLTVTMVAATAEAPAAERERYSQANRPLIGRPIVLHLDRLGGVRSIDGLDAVWADWSAGLAAAAPAGRPGEVLRARLDEAPPERRRAVIGSLADALFAAHDERAPAPPRPVTLTSPAPFADVTAAGTVVALAEPGGIRVRTTASGRAAAGAGGEPASVAIALDRLVDPSSGVIRSATRRETLSGRGLRLSTSTRVTVSW